MTWSAGDAVVVQEVWRDRVWAAKPMRVVRDDGDCVALWFPKGTRWKAPTLHPTLPPGRGIFVERGVFDPVIAERVREEGLEVARRAERDEWPFDGRWADWRPDPSWPLPELARGWDAPCR